VIIHEKHCLNPRAHQQFHENVLIEGTIGKLQHAEFTKGIVLEIIGDKGVLRINLTQNEIKQSGKGIVHPWKVLSQDRDTM
jgi:hypothetical protein